VILVRDRLANLLSTFSIINETFLYANITTKQYTSRPFT
jgi:hypothetical protein